MSNEEAVEILLKMMQGYASFSQRLAISKAIKSLKQPEIIRCEDCVYFVREEYFDGCKKYSSFSFRPKCFCSNARRKE